MLQGVLVHFQERKLCHFTPSSLNWGQGLKDYFVPLGAFFLFKEDIILEGLYHPEKQIEDYKNLSVKISENERDVSIHL